jgi:hypothetical protein
VLDQSNADDSHDPICVVYFESDHEGRLKHHALSGITRLSMFAGIVTQESMNRRDCP